MDEIADIWVPHQPATWPWRLATLKCDTPYREWHGARDDQGEPQFDYRTLAAGTTVKVVMVSRFGDVGITDNLSAEHGYGARVWLDDLTAKAEP